MTRSDAGSTIRWLWSWHYVFSSASYLSSFHSIPPRIPVPSQAPSKKELNASSPTPHLLVSNNISSRAEGDGPADGFLDGHNDLAIFIRARFNNHIYEKNFTHPFEEGGMAAHVDLPRLAEGQNGGAFWSAFVPCPKNASDFSDLNYADCKLGSSFISSLFGLLFLLAITCKYHVTICFLSLSRLHRVCSQMLHYKIRHHYVFEVAYPSDINVSQPLPSP